MPSSTRDSPPFSPRWPWLGGDLQTLRNALVRPRVRLASDFQARIELGLQDGSDDTLLAIVDMPLAAVAGCACVVLIHGLTGCSESAYMRASAAHFLSRGHAVVRLNLRGAGPGRSLARGHYHAGCSRDLADALARLDGGVIDEPLVAIGFSLGGNALLKHLGEAGSATPLRAAIAVSPPIDLADASRRLSAPRNALYHRYLLRRMKAEMLAAPGPVPEARRRTIADARDVFAFDDRVVAPDNGFLGAEDYYARCSAAARLDAVTCPTLVIHAADDPWIPAEPFGRRPRDPQDPVTMLLPPSGGHVGFHGRGSREPWHDRAAAWFLGRHGLAR